MCSLPQHKSLSRVERREYRGHTILTYADVQAIRRWALAHPDMTLAGCARALQEDYPVASSTLVDVIRNVSWTDLSYVPVERMTLAPRVPIAIPLRELPQPDIVPSPSNNLHHRRKRDIQMAWIKEALGKTRKVAS